MMNKIKVANTDKVCNISRIVDKLQKITLSDPRLIFITSLIFWLIQPYSTEIIYNNPSNLVTIGTVYLFTTPTGKSSHLITPTRPGTQTPNSTTSPRPPWSVQPGISLSFTGIPNNKLMKICNGNRKLGYNLAMWNCRKGLVTWDGEGSSKMVDVKEFISKKKLHMLCLIESDLHSISSRIKRVNPLTTTDILKKLDIPGYKIYLPQSWKQHGQARILVYAREDLNVKEWVVGNQSNDLPTISFLIALGKEKKTIVNFFYREFTGGVSGLGDNQAQTERLSRQIRHWRVLARSNYDLVCLGDANLCAQRWNDEDYNRSEHAEMIQSFLLDTSSTQLVRDFTRSEFVQGGEISRSCIDHCYTSSPEKLSKPDVVAVGESDHLGVVVTKYVKIPKIKPRTVTKRSYKDFSVETFLTEVLNSKIDENVTACESLEEAAEVFEEMFKKILDRNAPIKTFQMRKNYSPYVSDKTKLLIMDRNALKLKAVNNADKIAEKEAKMLGKKIKKSILSDEKEYYSKDFGDNMDSSVAWRTTKVILGINSNLAPTVIKTSDEDGNVEMVTNPQKLANIFNKFFRKKVQTLREETNQPPTINPTERLRSWLEKRQEPPPPFQLKIIDKQMLRKIVQRMKPKRVHGTDWIDSYSLKIASPIIEDSLIHLINLSITQSKFSNRWKPQLILPTHKKKERDKVENYRPVSHLVQVGKMVEYAIYFQIVEHFTNNNLFHPNHHGSLANHSTATAIIQLFDGWLEAAENKNLSAVCLLDQSAAYDLLCHKTLEEKLKLYNFSGPSIEWMMSYLSNRTQVVKVESKISAPINCEDTGVPQGSVLGGLVHVINSNDFPDCHEVGESIVYVDDDSDSVNAAEPDVLQNLIQQEATNSAQWLKDNRLCVAGDKSKLIVIGTKELKDSKGDTDISITIDDKEIVTSESEKLLGVVINGQLTWKNHLYGDKENEGLISQLTKRVGLMKRLTKYMNVEKLKFFANGIFYSKLNYCLSVFGNVFGLDTYKEGNTRYTSFTMKDNNKLQVLQNKLNRLIIKADNNTSTAELLERTGSLSIQQTIAYQTATMTQRIIQSKKPMYIAEKLKIHSNNLNLRRQRTIVQPKCKLSIAREGFIYRSASLYNLLDKSLKNEPKIEIFKTKVKNWIRKNIAIKPSSKYPSLAGGRVRNRHTLETPPNNQPPRHNTIRRYFQPMQQEST